MRVETPGGVAEESIIVPGLSADLDAYPNHDKLRKIATSTGGKWVGRGDDLLREVEAYGAKSQNQFTEERRVPLWGRVYVLIFILFFLGTEWYLRRKWGMSLKNSRSRTSRC